MKIQKKVVTALAVLSTIMTVAFAQDKTAEYKDYSVVGVNRLEGRASFWYYSNREDAKKVSYLYSPENISLNGKWSFSFAERPADREVDFYKTDYDTSSWDKIDVPGSWPMQGYDRAVYLNHPYEFELKNPYPVEIPDSWNPVGSYARDFEVPKNWNGKRVVLHFGAVKSSFYVWVNGKKVGYSQDSKMQAEFDITPYIKVGANNKLAVEVYRFSMGSYLEGQDMWRLAGIKRDVTLYATEKSYVADFFAATTLENDYKDGVLDLNIEISGDKASKSELSVELLSPSGDVVFEKSIKTPKQGSYNIKTTVDNCKSWSDESPTLYTLILGYNNGKTTTYQASKVGFRSVELKNSQMLVNGKAVRIKGVNRHEHHPKLGHYIPVETMEADVRLMKEFNVNAIRTCHYPADPYLYELSDKYGLFICDEANVETHGLGATLQAYYDPEKHIADDIAWQDIMHDRFVRMFERDKNHPSVIVWSMGNECGDGVVFENGYKLLKSTDSTRLVVFEQAGMKSHTDIVGPMYATMDKIKNYALAPDTYRPLILCEYAHAMGNSLGNFADYWELFDSYPNLQGGYIWDWVDQGVEDFRDGVRFLDYGGAYGFMDDENSGAFCLNGIVDPDRVPNPHAYEMRKVYDNVDVKLSRNNSSEFVVLNKNRFTDLSHFDARWSLLKDGRVVESGDLMLSCAPEKETTVKIDFKDALTDNSDYFVNFEFATKTDENYLKKGHIVAAEQLQLKKSAAQEYISNSTAKLELEKVGEAIVIKGESFEYKFNEKNGRLFSMVVSGEEFLMDDTQYDFYRVRVDNDGWDKDAKYWKDAHKNTDLVDFEYKNDGDKVVVSAKTYIEANKKERLNGDFTTVYTIYSDGTIEVDNTFVPTSYHAEVGVSIPRLGERYTLDGSFSKVEWYGRGPWENYADRKTAAFVGRYAMDIEDLTHYYINPQENGYRTDSKEIVFENDKGSKLIISGKIPLSFSASHYPKENYFEEDGLKIRNTVDLKRSENLYLNVDYGQQGIGGDNSWGQPVHTEYKILLRAYNYGYYIKPTVK